jgi:hypothetical protein
MDILWCIKNDTTKFKRIVGEKCKNYTMNLVKKKTAFYFYWNKTNVKFNF